MTESDMVTDSAWMTCSVTVFGFYAVGEKCYNTHDINIENNVPIKGKLSAGVIVKYVECGEEGV